MRGGGTRGGHGKGKGKGMEGYGRGRGWVDGGFLVALMLCGTGWA